MKPIDLKPPKCKSKSNSINCGIQDSSGSVFCRVLDKRIDGDRICIFLDRYKKEKQEKI